MPAARAGTNSRGTVIRICVVLGLGEAPGPGERRLLAALRDDARFELACVTAAPGPSATLPPALRWVMAVEQRLFPAPDAAPDSVHAVQPLEAAAATHYDVVVDFSHADAALDLGPNTAHGIWRLSSFEEAAGLGEARDRAPVTAVTLTRHATGVPSKPLACALYDTKFLATRNAAFIREKSIQLVIQALARLANGGSAETVAVAPAPARRFRIAELPGYLARTVAKMAIRAARVVSERIGMRPGMFFLRVAAGNPLDFDPAKGTDLVAPGNAYWADPFLFKHEGTLYLFYEEYDYKTGLGHLCVGRMDGDRLTPLGTALKRPYHLSYPFVFGWGNEILMIPETHAAKRIEVWRATSFPTEWELANVALEGLATADSVVFEHKSAWWLLTNICSDSFGDFGSDLHLYSVDSPMLNEVEPHPLNPVVIDTTVARGGGRAFEHNGRLLRVSQNNSHGIYGFGLNLMEIGRVDANAYEERLLRQIVPDFSANIMACHHLDSAAGRVVFDIRRRAFGAARLRRR